MMEMLEFQCCVKHLVETMGDCRSTHSFHFSLVFCSFFRFFMFFHFFIVVGVSFFYFINKQSRNQLNDKWKITCVINVLFLTDFELVFQLQTNVNGRQLFSTKKLKFCSKIIKTCLFCCSFNVSKLANAKRGFAVVAFDAK